MDKPTSWWSPARFVPKANGAPKLVINFKGLNAVGSRIWYPFLSAEEIHHKVHNGTAIFVALDLVNSYFQIRVKEECIPLLTFILQQCKFSMTTCDQGHHDVMDQLNVKTCQFLAGVDQAKKIIDDLLLMPRSLTDAYRDRALVL